MSNLCALLLSVLAGASEPTGSVEISISDLRNDQGQVLVALHDSAASFPRNASAALLRRSLTARNGRASTTFSGLPAGDYAIAVLHDENGNEELDTNLLGIPKEGIGISNNVKIRRRSPRFEDAKFSVAEGEVRQRIRMHYW